jgi:hypothetical protein
VDEKKMKTKQKGSGDERSKKKKTSNNQNIQPKKNYILDPNMGLEVCFLFINFY